MPKRLIEKRTIWLLAFAGSTIMFSVAFLVIAAWFENPTRWLLSQHWLIVGIAVVAFPSLLITGMWRAQIPGEQVAPPWLVITYSGVLSWSASGLILILLSLAARLFTDGAIPILGKAATLAVLSWIGARIAVAVAAALHQVFNPPAPPPAEQ
jgi:hypothetical protein